MTELTPQQVRTAAFRTVRKGFDPQEVAAFLRSTAEALEVAQNQSAAMEARARAAVSRLQELSSGRDPTPVPPAPPPPEELHAPIEESQVISRTLLLAQRTADQTVADATAEAERILAAAREEAESTIDSTREMSARIVEDARAEARSANDEERRRAREEVEALLARRDFLVADVDHLEAFLVDQRERIRDAAGELLEICDRVPSGLAGVRKPLLSASADDADGEPVADPDATMAIDTMPIDTMAIDAVEPADASLSEHGEPVPTPQDDEAGGAEPGEAAEDLVIRTELDEHAGEQPGEDRTPATGEPQLRFDADELRRLGESRGIG